MNIENCRYLYLNILPWHRALPYVPTMNHYRALPELFLAGRKVALARHVIGSVQHLNLVQYFISGMFMWSEKVIIGNL